MRNIRSEINYCLGNKALVVSLTKLADLQTGNGVKMTTFGWRSNKK